MVWHLETLTWQTLAEAFKSSSEHEDDPEHACEGTSSSFTTDAAQLYMRSALVVPKQVQMCLARPHV